MAPPTPTSALTAGPLCADRPLRVQGDVTAVAGAVERLVAGGWDLAVDPVRQSGDIWALWRDCGSCGRGC